MRNYKKKNHSRQSSYSDQNLIPYEVLDAAIAGDASAIYEVVKYYHSYMAKTMTECKYNFMSGRLCDETDEDGVGVLRVALIQGLSKFDKMY